MKENQIHSQFKTSSMQNPKKYLGQSMDDIVFDGRNKEYGAYQIRRSTVRYISVGLSAGLVFMFGVSAFSLNHGEDKKEERVIISDVTTVENEIKLPDVKPPAPQPPIQHATVAYREMAPVEDQKVTDDPPRVDELAGKAIALDNHDGIFAENPMVEDPVIIQTPVIEESKIFKVVEQPPVYDGGFDAMNAWLANKIRYPKLALENNVSGPVYIQFVVDEEGNISDAKVVRGIGFGCDEEALKAVQKMPKWIPGKQQGKAVKVQFTIPVQFIIS